jgi:hypothetical protein
MSNKNRNELSEVLRRQVPGRQGNVAQLRPDVGSDVASAQKNADTGNPTTEKDFKPKGKPKRVSG